MNDDERRKQAAQNVKELPPGERVGAAIAAWLYNSLAQASGGAPNAAERTGWVIGFRLAAALTIFAPEWWAFYAGKVAATADDETREIVAHLTRAFATERWDAFDEVSQLARSNATVPEITQALADAIGAKPADVNYLDDDGAV